MSAFASGPLSFGATPGSTVKERREFIGHVLAALSRESTLEGLYSHAMEAVAVALHVERASLLIFDHADVCRFVAWRGLSDGYRAAVDGHSPWSPGDLHAEPIAVADVSEDPSLEAFAPTLAAENIRALLFLPLVGRGRLWGKFVLYAADQRVFTAEEIETAQLIVREIAASLDWRQRDQELLEERQLFSAGPTVVFKWRNAERWPIEYVSANLFAQFGYAPQELISGAVQYADIVYANDLERIEAEMLAHVAAGDEWFEQEYRLRHKDGRIRTVTDFKKVVRASDGVATHFLGYLVDVSERRAQDEEHARIEEQVRRTQKLESLGVLAGGIAHDFNNLLVGMLGNASLAVEELPDHSSARPLLEDLQVAARRAAELTRQLLADSGKGRFVVEPVDLSALVREMGRLLTTVVSKKAHIVSELRDDLPRVRADATQLRQVVMNVITNASDALGDAPGTITIRTRRMHATRAWLASAQVGADIAEGEYLVLEVSDTGVGLHADDMPRIFDPFFSSKGPGRGLGLAAVLGIVRAHRGAVRIVSTAEQGTTVAVLLPADDASTDDPSESKATAGRHHTVLVVDDDAAALRVAERVLQRDGYRVLTAPHGRAALEVYAERGPAIDAVLLDLTMPELSGWETLRELRQLDPSVTVLLMSGYAQEPGASIDGAAGFLAKPYSAEELRTAMAGVLASAATP
ncbi:response regulator [Gemmatimonas sp.]|uniref:hybrid sensor histidine kinase/response regulator n=1 Tax=Gemmatimonas sp. TaxID=1962908 RepID=UPI00333FFA24